MRVAIMQPYFFPYIGYFQLINAVDKFIIYDNLEFTKKGWIHRNRYLQGAADSYFTLPLKKGSDFLKIDERELADTFRDERSKILRKLKGAYQQAPYYDQVFNLINEAFCFEDVNLFRFVYNSIGLVCNYLDITTTLIISSQIPIDHQLKGEKKVIALCKATGATEYLNPIGGVELYSKSNFQAENVQLNFTKSDPIVYSQYRNQFVPWLSIIDVMMFNSKEQVKDYLQKHSRL